jgi:6-phosphogluconolactonase
VHREIKLFPDIDLLVRHLAGEFQQISRQALDHNRVINIALSGGNTPEIFFKYLAKHHIKNKINWHHVHLYWGDERCVPPDHDESNFGRTHQALLRKIELPESHVHRIQAELAPPEAIRRYEQVIRAQIGQGDTGLPIFDWIFLGLGNDGHTASIFPNSKLNTFGSSICAVSSHPQSGQKRITLQIEVINHARRVSFLVTGKAKAEVVAKVLKQPEEYPHYPATWVASKEGITEWYLDDAAAALLKI